MMVKSWQLQKLAYIVMQDWEIKKQSNNNDNNDNNNNNNNKIAVQ